MESVRLLTTFRMQAKVDKQWNGYGHKSLVQRIFNMKIIKTVLGIVFCTT
ncbi:hypothetical protein [Legionella feeleii]|uniref:Uncharacterized protein n=1 Tax=Legionella feeleii TaxID=453 RepID=A0A2X1QPR3_9GAMM|nr:hypothetical protein [Legionella feeleii]SPX59307.1 Uncharacterised protein [Legionella feeleii]